MKQSKAGKKITSIAGSIAALLFHESFPLARLEGPRALREKGDGASLEPEPRCHRAGSGGPKVALPLSCRHAAILSSCPSGPSLTRLLLLCSCFQVIIGRWVFKVFLYSPPPTSPPSPHLRSCWVSVSVASLKLLGRCIVSGSGVCVALGSYWVDV